MRMGTVTMHAMRRKVVPVKTLAVRTRMRKRRIARGILFAFRVPRRTVQMRMGTVTMHAMRGKVVPVKTLAVRTVMGRRLIAKRSDGRACRGFGRLSVSAIVKGFGKPPAAAALRIAQWAVIGTVWAGRFIGRI